MQSDYLDSVIEENGWNRELRTFRQYYDVNVYQSPFPEAFQPSNWENSTNMSLVCRGQISEEFIAEALSQSNLLITVSYPLSEEWKQYNRENNILAADTLVAFALVTVDYASLSAYLYLICASPIKYGEKVLPIRLGLALHGFVVRHLAAEDITTIYLDAATPKLIPYYEGLGYVVSDDSCLVRPEPATTPGLIDWIGGLFAKPTGAPKLNITKHGVKMRMCNTLTSPILAKSESALQGANQTLSSTLNSAYDWTQLQPQLYNPPNSLPLTLGVLPYDPRKVTWVWENPTGQKSLYFDKNWLHEVADFPDYQNLGLKEFLDNNPIPSVKK